MMIATKRSLLAKVSVVCLLALSVLSMQDLYALELNRTFSDDMVLQRDKPVKVWGTAKAGDTVTVSFAGQAAKATADKDGRWVATLKPLKASAKGEVISVQSSVISEPLKVKNVVIGDVFLFARQSSIDVSLGSTPEGKKAAKSGKGFRFIRIKTTPSRTPLANLKEDATAGWQVVDKKSALTMSAAAFYLGRDLAKEVDVPVGIVDLDMGYHFPAAWLSEKGLELAQGIPGKGADALKRECEYLSKDIEAWDKGISDYVRDYANPKHPPKKYEGPLRGASPLEMPYAPSVCYNAVIHPLRGMAVKGMLLQLGNDYPWVLLKRLRRLGKIGDRTELLHATGQGYPIFKEAKIMTPQVLPVVASDLRGSLGDASLPVAWIMPPGSDKYDYATQNQDVREIQRRAAAENKGIDLVLPGAGNIRMSGQPADEALLASRCKQWVSSTFYDGKGAATGPLFDGIKFKNGVGIVFFKSGTADGLSVKGDALKHFEMAGEDGKFSPCEAKVEGSTVELKCDQVSNPISVRYSWCHRPAQGLVNSAGLPALPFNTDAKWVYEPFPDLGPIAEHEDTGADIAVVTAVRHSDVKHPEHPVVLFGDATMLNHGAGPAKYPKDQWQSWRLLAVEVAGHAPEGWQKPEYDDSDWDEVILPTAWPRGHVGLLRTTFEVDDAGALESLMVESSLYKVRDFKVYLNGHLVARVHVDGRALGAKVPLTPYAMGLLKNGKNDMAVIADHGRRHVKFGLALVGRVKR